VRYHDQSTYAIPQAVAPGIFTLADGSGVIQHSSDYRLVTLSNPAKPGEVIIIYVTGLGVVSPTVPDGEPTTGPDVANAPGVFVGSVYENVLYAGMTPGYPGLYQLNVQLSPATPSGLSELYVAQYEIGLWPPDNNSLFQSNTVNLPVE